MTEQYHIPVLLQQSVEALNINPNGIYIDATYGGGGHSKLIYKHLTAKGKLIAFDQDTDAKNNTFNAPNFILIQANFRYIKNFINYLGIEQVDGILADLGLSTHHIDTPQRGFSFRFNARLDMRMNLKQSKDAYFVINKYNQNQLSQIFYEYGELKNSKKIAETIIKNRQIKPIETTFELVEILKPFTPLQEQQKFLAKVFQAIRIEVNEEIQCLKEFILSANQLLKPNGKIAIISYHSLEDSLVKNFFKSGNFDGIQQKDIYGNIIRPLETSGKLIVPDATEIQQNNRARSAKLRIATKL